MSLVGLRLLGPIELVADGRPLAIGGPRQRIVLATLGLNVNRVTPVEQLVDAVWDTEPPSTARAQIQICISALRKVFAGVGRPEAITTRPPGYLLRLAPDEVDGEEFAGLFAAARADAEAGRNADAATALRSALALWRGPTLSGVDSEVVRRGAAVLDDRRLGALAERLRLDLALGRHEEIIGELRGLLGEHPLHEKLYGLLMLALYRGGRQAEALEVFRTARTTLVDELGVEPGAELRELERAVLNRDPGLDPAPVAPEQPVVPSQLPSSIADFTGRREQLDTIKAALTAGPAYALPIVTIFGRAGVGKSSLAVRAAHELGQAFPDGHLYAELSTTNGQDRTARLLGRFLRALGVSGTGVPDDIEERVDLYRSRLAGKRVLMVLDDVSTEDQVIPLLPGSPSCAVICTSRAPLDIPGAHRLGIDVFDVDSALELLGKIVGGDRVSGERAAAVELVRLCGGLPLALRIAGARLAARAHWPIDGLVARLADETHRLDELTHHGLELRSNIGLSYRGLSEQARRLFRLLALLEAPDFPMWTAAALLDTDRHRAEELVESLVEAQLLEVVRDRYRFHDLIRVYARERLLESETDYERRAALARALSGWLALAEEAHRREHGGDYTVMHGKAPRWHPPADVIGEPTEWWERERLALVVAVRQAAELGMAELCWDLAHTSVTLFEVKGYFDDWRETARIALDAVVAAGNRFGEAVMRYTHGSLHLFEKRLDEAQSSYEKALTLFEAEGYAHGRALVLRNSASIDRLRGNTERMRVRYQEALNILRVVGDRGGEAHVLRNMAKYDIVAGELVRAAELLEQALAIGTEIGYRRGEAQVLYCFGQLYASTGRTDDAIQAWQRTLRIVRELGDPIGEAYTLHELGALYQREALPDAEPTLIRALELAERLGEQLVEARVLRALGRSGAADAVFERLGVPIADR